MKIHFVGKMNTTACGLGVDGRPKCRGENGCCQICSSLKCLLNKVSTTTSAEHKDSDEKKSSAKGSAETTIQLAKPEPAEAEPPKAEVNGTADELQCEGDTQSN